MGCEASSFARTARSVAAFDWRLFVDFPDFLPIFPTPHGPLLFQFQVAGLALTIAPTATQPYQYAIGEVHGDTPSARARRKQVRRTDKSPLRYGFFSSHETFPPTKIFPRGTRSRSTSFDCSPSVLAGRVFDVPSVLGTKFDRVRGEDEAALKRTPAGRRRQLVRRGRDEVVRVSWHPTSKILATASADGSRRVARGTTGNGSIRHDT